MKDNPFHDLISTCLEHIKNSPGQDENTYMSTFSLVLWKRLSEKTGDQGFAEARTKAVVKDQAAELIHKGMIRFEEEYPDETKGMFDLILKHGSYYNEDGNMLIRLLDYLNDISLQNIFERGSAHEYVEAMEELSFYSPLKGKFSVPVSMPRLMRSVLSIQEKDRVFAFGCAPVISILDCFINEKSSLIFAQDMNIRFAIMAKVLLALFNIDHSRIVPQNFVEQPAFVKDGKLETFDCVFGVPHLGGVSSEQAEKLRNDPYGRFPQYYFDRFSKELVALDHALKVLKPKIGRGAILVPQIFLSMMNTRKIRTYMVSMNYIDTIAALPRYLFPGLNKDLALLVFRMDKQDKKVNFIDAEPLCNKADRSIDQKKFLEIYFNRADSKHSMLVDNTKILGHDSSLFPSVYQNIKPDKERKSVQHLRDELSGIDGRLREVQKRLDSRLGRSE